jgi:hypothetical protein
LAVKTTLNAQQALINNQKMKVKCDSYAFGFFDEIKLENKFSNVLMIIKPKVMWYRTLYRLTQTHNKKAQA